MAIVLEAMQLALRVGLMCHAYYKFRKVGGGLGHHVSEDVWPC
jgi:hypothetical protein